MYFQTSENVHTFPFFPASGLQQGSSGLGFDPSVKRPIEGPVVEGPTGPGKPRGPCAYGISVKRDLIYPQKRTMIIANLRNDT